MDFLIEIKQHKTMNENNYLKEALKLQMEAKKIGLDWLDLEGIIQKIHEETNEVSIEIKNNNRVSIKEELGDLLFTFICLTRHLNISIDEILSDANKKFKKRYDQVKNILEEKGKSYADPEEMDTIWRSIKD